MCRWVCITVFTRLRMHDFNTLYHGPANDFSKPHALGLQAVNLCSHSVVVRLQLGNSGLQALIFRLELRDLRLQASFDLKCNHGIDMSFTRSHSQHACVFSPSSWLLNTMLRTLDKVQKGVGHCVCVCVCARARACVRACVFVRIRTRVCVYSFEKSEIQPVEIRCIVAAVAARVARFEPATPRRRKVEAKGEGTRGSKQCIIFTMHMD